MGALFHAPSALPASLLPSRLLRMGVQQKGWFSSCPLEPRGLQACGAWRMGAGRGQRHQPALAAEAGLPSGGALLRCLASGNLPWQVRLWSLGDVERAAAHIGPCGNGSLEGRVGRGSARAWAQGGVAPSPPLARVRSLKLGAPAGPRGDLAQMERSVGRLRTMHSKMLMDIEKVQIHFGGSVKASSQMIRELLQAQCLSSPCYKR